MRSLTRSGLACLLMLGVLAWRPAQSAAPASEETEQWVRSMVLSNLITLQCALPEIQPKVTTLKRSWTPVKDELMAEFFGGPQGVFADEAVISPLWGNGRRFKSGMIINLAPENQQTKLVNLNQISGVESVPTFLDLYSTGFVYANNIPHTAVYATDVKVLEPTKADVTRTEVYTEAEGQAAVEALIAEMFGKLSVPAGFQPSVQVLIQHFGERLFVYRAQPEYITSFDETLADGTLKTHQVAVPVRDVYVHVMLDGDKMLCGLEYFWDASLAPLGAPEPCIKAWDAIEAAKTELMQSYSDHPPLLTVTQLTLGFVQDRKDRNKLVPAWLFDAWYNDFQISKDLGLPVNPDEQTAAIPMPFAINALTKELMML